MKPGKNIRTDIAIAKDALLLVPGISNTARRVGGLLLKHYNLKTGRCDPSIRRLAKLLGSSERNVARALVELTEGRKPTEKQTGSIPILFMKKSHGGRSLCSAYRPNFPVKRQIVEEFEMRLRLKTQQLFETEACQESEETLTDLSSDPGQDCHESTDDTVRQTLSKNPSERTLDDSERSATSTDTASPSNAQNSQQQQKVVKPDFNEQQFQKVDFPDKSISHREAARQAALGRIHDAFHRIGGDVYMTFIALPDDVHSHAVEEEIRKQGAGIDYIRIAIRMSNEAASEGSRIQPPKVDHEA